MDPEGKTSESRVQRLYSRAKEVRAVAEAMSDLQYRRTTLLTAESYERMAKQLESLALLQLPEEPSPQLTPDSG